MCNDHPAYYTASLVLPNRACLAERFSAKNGDPPEAKNFGRIDFSLGRWIIKGKKKPKSTTPYAKVPGELVRIFFWFTIQAAAITFLWLPPKLY